MSEVIAAVLGALVVWGTTYFMERRKLNWARQENAAHLGVVILVLLERFIADCAKVAGDDGTSQGRPAGQHADGEEYYTPQTSIPALNLDDLEVEWRAISPGLMYAIHSIALEVTEAEEHLEDVSDNDFPPYDWYMNARQHQFAKIGVSVADIARQLRNETGIPERPEKEWNAEAFLRDRLRLFEEKQASKQDSLPSEGPDAPAS